MLQAGLRALLREEMSSEREPTAAGAQPRRAPPVAWDISANDSALTEPANASLILPKGLQVVFSECYMVCSVHYWTAIWISTKTVFYRSKLNTFTGLGSANCTHKNMGSHYSVCVGVMTYNSFIRLLVMITSSRIGKKFCLNGFIVNSDL